MSTPFHPVIVHIPLVISLIMPILVLIFAVMIKLNKLSPRGWLVIIGFQLMTTISGYVALESGEIEEDIVEKIVDKKYINEHENAAEIYVGSTVLVLVFCIAVFFISEKLQLKMQILIALLAIASSALGYRAGKYGGELVYKYGAASAYLNSDRAGILPMNSQESSESPIQTHENESLKTDDNDYGNVNDESTEVEEDNSKQED